MEYVFRDPASVTEGIRQSPVHARLGLTVVQQELGRVVLTMDNLSHEDVGGLVPGTIHGGVLATLADVANAVALEGTYDLATEQPVTTDMHVRYYRQPRGGPLKATGTMVHRGRRLLSSECVVTDAEDRVLVRSTATYMVVRLDQL
jgi:uncharacterized protein (TIGR00369 family)